MLSWIKREYTLFVSRENLKQWEKVMRGEEAYGWIPTQSHVGTGTSSDLLPVKIDD